MKYQTQKSCFCDYIHTFMWGSLRGCVFLLAVVYPRIKGSYKDESGLMQCLSELFPLDTDFCKGLRDRSKTKWRFLSQCLISVCLSFQRPIRIPSLVTFPTCSRGVNLQVGDCESRTFYMFIEQSPENFRFWWISVYWLDVLFILHRAGKPKYIL